jgi:hypothetical protein
MEQYFKGRIRRTLESTRNFGKHKEILWTISKHAKRERSFQNIQERKRKLTKLLGAHICTEKILLY